RGHEAGVGGGAEGGDGVDRAVDVHAEHALLELADEEHAAAVVDDDAARLLDVRLQRRPALAREDPAARPVAPDRPDDAVFVDAPDAVVVAVGDDDGATALDRDTEREAQLRVHRGAAVAVEPEGAGAGDARDGAVGVDAADAAAGDVGDEDAAEGVDGD